MLSDLINSELRIGFLLFVEMLLRLRSILNTAPPRLVVGCPAARGQRMPMVPVADLWAVAPGKWVDDKVWYWFWHVRLTILGTFAMFYVYHKPFQGADYKAMWQSPRYKWHVHNLKSAGVYYDNLAIKRNTFYLPEELESEPIEPVPIGHPNFFSPFTLMFQRGNF